MTDNLLLLSYLFIFAIDNQMNNYPQKITIMKKLIFALLSFLMIISANAVEYEYDPLVKEGKVWVECEQNSFFHVDHLNYYQFHGTTTINGCDYLNLYATINTRVISDEDIPIAFVRENDKKVYVILNGLAHGKDYQWGQNGDFVPIYGCQLVDDQIGLYIMYDFINYLNPYTTHFDYYHMNSTLCTNQMQIGDHLANYFSVISFYYAPYSSMYYSIAEGIGPLSRAFINLWNDDVERWYLGLAWVEDNGEIIYRGNLYNEAVDFMSYVPLVREGVKWIEYYKNTIEDTQYVTYYQFSGEEHIGDHDYSKLYATNTDTISPQDTPVAYVREEDKQVFIIPTMVEVNGCALTDESINEYKIYDFNDITSPYTVGEYLIDPVDTNPITINNNLVNMYTLGGTKQIVEGIGCLDYVFFNPWHIELPDGSHSALAWVEDNGVMVYKNDDCYEEAEAVSGYVKLVREGVVWEYVSHYQAESYSDSPRIYTLKFEGKFNDTNENGDTIEYYNLYRTDYDKHGKEQETYLVAVVNENGKIVKAIKNNNYWWWDEWSGDSRTMYDFTRLMFLPEEAMEHDPEWGDSYPWYVDPDRVKRIQVDVAGNIRKGYHINYDDGSNNYAPRWDIKIIEGIGIDCWYGDLLLPYRDFYSKEVFWENPSAGLSAVYENGVLVYKGCAYDEAQHLKNPVVGDLDGDGFVTSADVTFLYTLLLGYGYSEDDDTYDINNDGAINSADITALYDILLGD